MAANSRNKSPLFLGCSSKIAIFCLLMLLSAGIGWLIGKQWVKHSNQPQTVKPVFATEENNFNSATDRAWQRKAEIRKRRLELGIDSQFFKNLVNELFNLRYGDLKEEKQKQEQRDILAEETLDRLDRLDSGTREGLGSYDEQQRQKWREKVNQLRLSSRVLNLLADNAFFQLFPELTERPNFDSSLGQLWSGLAWNQLQSLQSGLSYQAIESLDAGGEEIIEGILSEGQGKAYALKLRSSDRLDLNLEAEGEVFIYFYSPSGNITLLDKSSDRQWSGQLPEDGFYELVIVPQSSIPVNFRLQLKATQ
jgi:serine/threonine-protein kinase